MCASNAILLIIKFFYLENCGCSNLKFKKKLFFFFLFCNQKIAEKKLIEQELQEEEKRLSEMMENERRWAIKVEKLKEEQDLAKKQEFARVLRTQIVENEEKRILDFERKQEESKLQNMKNIVTEQEEIEKIKGKDVESTKVRHELAEANAMLQHFKLMQREENKMLDLRYIICLHCNIFFS